MDSQAVLPENRAAAADAATVAAERAATSRNGDSISSRSESNQQLQSEQQNAAFVPLCNSLLADRARADFLTAEPATAADFESAAGPQTPFESWLKSFARWKATQASRISNEEDASPTTPRVANGSLDATASSKAATGGAMLRSAVTTQLGRPAAGQTGFLQETVADPLFSQTENGGAHAEKETGKCFSVGNINHSGNSVCTKHVFREKNCVLHSIERGDRIQNSLEDVTGTSQEIFSASGAIEEAEADNTGGTRAQGERAPSGSFIKERREQIASILPNVELVHNKGADEREQALHATNEQAAIAAEKEKEENKEITSMSEIWLPLAAGAIAEKKNSHMRKEAAPVQGAKERTGKAYITSSNRGAFNSRARLYEKTDCLEISGSDEELLYESIGSSHMLPVRNMAWHVTQFMKGIRHLMRYGCGVNGCSVPEKKSCGIGAGRASAAQPTAVARENGTPTVVVDLSEAGKERPLLEDCVRGLGWRMAKQQFTTEGIAWLGNAISDEEHVQRARRSLTVNRIPGLYEFARKRWLTRILSSMQQLDPEGFSFFPRTWLLPEDRAAVEQALQSPPVVGAVSTFGSRRSWTRTQSEALPFSSNGKSSNNNTVYERFCPEPMHKQDKAGAATMPQGEALGDGLHALVAMSVVPEDANVTVGNERQGVTAAFAGATNSPTIDNFSGFSRHSSLLPLLRGGRTSRNLSSSDGGAAVAIGGGLAAAGEKLRCLGRKLRAIGTQIDAEFEKERDCFIFKPDNGAQGLGVRMVTAEKCIPEDIMAGRDGYIVQQYIKNPYLLRNKKFDFRIYVLILSVYPKTQIFLARRGLVRFCTVEYEAPRPENLNNEYMHLTNYAINKEHTAYTRAAHVHDKANGKRLLEDVFEELQQDGVDVDDVWQQIVALVEKTMAVLAPFLTLRYKTTYNQLLGPYSRCFQIIGLDILLDDTCKAWLLEVNANPSLRADYDCNTLTGMSYTAESELDRRIKEPLLREALVLVYFCLVKPQLLLHQTRSLCHSVVNGRVSERQRRRSKCGNHHDCLSPLPNMLAASQRLDISSSQFGTQAAALKSDAADAANFVVSCGAFASDNARELRDGRVAVLEEPRLPSQILLGLDAKCCSSPAPAAVSAAASNTVTGAAEAVAAAVDQAVRAISADSSYDSLSAFTLLKRGDGTNAAPAAQQKQPVEAKNSFSIIRLHGRAQQRAAETAARAHSPLRSSHLSIRRIASCEEWKEPLTDMYCKAFVAKEDDKHTFKRKPLTLEGSSPPVETGTAVLQFESSTASGAFRRGETRGKPPRFGGGTARQSVPPQQRPSTDSTSATLSDRLARNYSLPSITGLASPRKRLRPADDRLEPAADKFMFNNVHVPLKGEIPAPQDRRGFVPAPCYSHLLLPKQLISASPQTPLSQTITADVHRGPSSDFPQSAKEIEIPDGTALEFVAQEEETRKDGEANVQKRVTPRDQEDAGVATVGVVDSEKKIVDALTGYKSNNTFADGFASRPLTREQESRQGFAVYKDATVNHSMSEITSHPLNAVEDRTVQKNTTVEMKNDHGTVCEVLNQTKMAQDKTQNILRQINNQVDTSNIKYQPTKYESRVSKSRKVNGDDAVEEKNAASSAVLSNDVLRHCCIWNLVDMSWVWDTTKLTDSTQNRSANTCAAGLLYRCRLLFELVTNFPASKTLHLEQWMTLCSRAKLEEHIQQLWVAVPVPSDESSQVADRPSGVLRKTTRTCRRFAQRPLGKRDLVLLYMRQLKKSINQQPTVKTGLRGLCFWNFWELVCTLSSLTHLLLMRLGDDRECRLVDGHFAAREQPDFTTRSASRHIEFDSISRTFLQVPSNRFPAFAEVGTNTGKGPATAANSSQRSISLLQCGVSQTSGQQELDSPNHESLEKISSRTRLAERFLQPKSASKMSCNECNIYTEVEQSGSFRPNRETKSRCGITQIKSTTFETDLMQHCTGRLDVFKAAAAEGCHVAEEKRHNAGRVGACIVQETDCNAQTMEHTDNYVLYSNNGGAEELSIAGSARRRNSAATTEAEVVCRSGTRIFVFSWPDVQKILDMMSGFQRARAVENLLCFLKSSYTQRML